MRRECGELFPRHRFQRKPLVSDPGMHHGTCETHVSWCMSGSLTCGGGENVPGIPGACATHNFTYLARDPCQTVAPSCVLRACRCFPMSFQSSSGIGTLWHASTGLYHHDGCRCLGIKYASWHPQSRNWLGYDDYATRTTWWASSLGTFRADSRFAPSRWETALLCNDVSH